MIVVRDDDKLIFKNCFNALVFMKMGAAGLIATPPQRINVTARIEKDAQTA